MEENRGGSYRQVRPIDQQPSDASAASPGSQNDPVVAIFIPSLIALLVNLEKRKGSPLTESEVLDIRDRGACMTVRASVARALADRRGYDDIDPEHAWQQWQEARARLAEQAEDPE